MRKHRLEILEETKATASREDAAILVARFVNHFPPRSTDQHAVIISDIAAACERHAISILGLAVALIELMEGASKQNPFLPPTGEIIGVARAKDKTYQAMLDVDRRFLREFNSSTKQLENPQSP